MSSQYLRMPWKEKSRDNAEADMNNECWVILYEDIGTLNDKSIFSYLEKFFTLSTLLKLGKSKSQCFTDFPDLKPRLQRALVIPRSHAPLQRLWQLFLRDRREEGAPSPKGQEGWHRLQPQKKVLWSLKAEILNRSRNGVCCEPSRYQARLQNTPSKFSSPHFGSILPPIYPSLCPLASCTF